jgi:hypothetical protein
MSELADAIARLEEAVARLDAAADPTTRAAADERLISVAAAIGRHIDTALARLGQLLEAEE